jgi:hypothetical protein
LFPVNSLCKEVQVRIYDLKTNKTILKIRNIL